MKYLLSILFVCLYSISSLAGVIPKDYNYVLLPRNTIDMSYTAFTSINLRGYAVGYGTSNNQYVGFVFNYKTKSIEASFNDFWLVGISEA